MSLQCALVGAGTLWLLKLLATVLLYRGYAQAGSLLHCVFGPHHDVGAECSVYILCPLGPTREQILLHTSSITASRPAAHALHTQKSCAGVACARDSCQTVVRQLHVFVSEFRGSCAQALWFDQVGWLLLRQACCVV